MLRCALFCRAPPPLPPANLAGGNRLWRRSWQVAGFARAPGAAPRPRRAKTHRGKRMHTRQGWGGAPRRDGPQPGAGERRRSLSAPRRWESDRSWRGEAWCAGPCAAALLLPRCCGRPPVLALSHPTLLCPHLTRAPRAAIAAVHSRWRRSRRRRPRRWLRALPRPPRRPPRRGRCTRARRRPQTPW